MTPAPSTVPGIYCYGDAQQRAAEASRERRFKKAIVGSRLRPITTEILPAPEFYYAETTTSSTSRKNPGGLLWPWWHRRQLPGWGRVGIDVPA